MCALRLLKTRLLSIAILLTMAGCFSESCNGDQRHSDGHSLSSSGFSILDYERG
jgi:hypothetical protein